jgi:hypothetical protein
VLTWQPASIELKGMTSRGIVNNCCCVGQWVAASDIYCTVPLQLDGFIAHVVCSAIWWGAYGFWQRLIWEQLPSHMKLAAAADGKSSPSTSAAVAVETVAGVLSGCTSALLTNPLDLVKTRLQASWHCFVGQQSV